MAGTSEERLWEIKKFEKRTGKIIIHRFAESKEEFVTKALEIEQHLNDKVATEIHKKYGLAIRFRI